jgi:choline dehydrogenase-like flavoprotein
MATHGGATAALQQGPTPVLPRCGRGRGLAAGRQWERGGGRESPFAHSRSGPGPEDPGPSQSITRPAVTRALPRGVKGLRPLSRKIQPCPNSPAAQPNRDPNCRGVGAYPARGEFTPWCKHSLADYVP